MNADQYFRQHREEHLSQLMEFLRIPSISALSAHKDDVRRAARWLEAELRRIGTEEVGILETGGHPAVYAERLDHPGKPTVLIYGHYDVQPVDPLNLWETPPFEPSIREGNLYARGASDDKGQVFMHLKVVEAILQAEREFPLNLPDGLLKEKAFLLMKHHPSPEPAQGRRIKAHFVDSQTQSCLPAQIVTRPLLGLAVGNVVMEHQQ